MLRRAVNDDRLTTKPLRAADFIQLNVESPKFEARRLHELYAQISHQPPGVKRALVVELLEILANRKERIWPRIQACNVLGGWWRQLEFHNTRAVTKRIRTSIQSEFFATRRLFPFQVRSKLTLRKLDVLGVLPFSIPCRDPFADRPSAYEIIRQTGFGRGTGNRSQRSVGQAAHVRGA
jgi:hypothetical protein